MKITSMYIKSGLVTLNRLRERNMVSPTACALARPRLFSELTLARLRECSYKFQTINWGGIYMGHSKFVVWLVK